MTLGKYFQNNGEGSTKVNCVVCDSNRYTPLFHIPPRRIVTCSNCDHEYVNPIFSPKDIPECIFHSTDESSIGTQIDITYLAKIFHKYDINNPHLTDKAPEKCLDFDKIHKIIIKGLDVNYLLQGNDLVINNLKEIEIKQNKEHLIIKGR